MEISCQNDLEVDAYIECNADLVYQFLWEYKFTIGVDTKLGRVFRGFYIDIDPPFPAEVFISPLPELIFTVNEQIRAATEDYPNLLETSLLLSKQTWNSLMRAPRITCP